MHKLAWTALGFTAGVLLAEYALPVQGLPYFAAALAVLSLAALPLKKGRRAVMLVLLAAACGQLWWLCHYRLHVQPCEELAGQTVTITARVTDYPRQTEDYTSVTVRVTDGAPGEQGVLFAYGDELPTLCPGDIIRAEVKVSSATERGGTRTHTYTARNQNLLGTVQDTAEVIGRWDNSWLYFPKVLSQKVKELCGELFSADTAAFMTALLTGDTDDLRTDESTYGSMRRAGVLHVVAVSGMHLMILTGFIQLVLGRSRRTSLLCIPVLVIFTLMAGCRPAVVRAAVMQGMLLLAPLLRREYDGLAGLSAALLLLLIINPMAAAGVGLQLSFACVLGFVLLLPGINQWLGQHWPHRKGLPSKAADSLACTVCATVFSLPLSVFYFGAVPLLSPAANLLTLPVVEVCFAGGYLLCALGVVLPAVAGAAAWVMDWLVRWCMLVYKTLGGLPFACLYSENGLAVPWLASVYALFCAWVILRRRGHGIRADIPVCLSVMSLCGVLLAGGRLGSASASLTALDVGQGECVVLTDGDVTAVVDCGGSGADNAGDVAADWLLSQGEEHIEFLILTHLHADHTNGVETLLERMDVDYLILPAGSDDADDMLAEIVPAAEENGTELVALSEDSLAEAGELELSLLLPQAGTDVNERGIVVLAEAGGQSALVMGDAGTDAELVLLEKGSIPDVDVLVAGHHGSKTASSTVFLDAAQAETAIVSVGYNSYGHPAEETMQRLEAACSTVLRTDEEGTITVSMDGEEEVDYG